MPCNRKRAGLVFQGINFKVILLTVPLHQGLRENNKEYGFIWFPRTQSLRQMHLHDNFDGEAACNEGGGREVGLPGAPDGGLAPSESGVTQQTPAGKHQ